MSSWPVIHDALNVTLTTYGLKPWTLEETTVRVRKSMRDSFPALFGDDWEAAGEVFYERYAAIHIEKLNLFPKLPKPSRPCTKTAFFSVSSVIKRGNTYARKSLTWDGTGISIT